MAGPDRRDRWWQKAKDEGYLSRAAYKLIQLDDRYHLLRSGDTVVDLGAAPGGWSQVAAERVGEEGRVVAVDRDRIRQVEGVERMRGDLTDDDTLEEIAATVGDADVVVSDMSPDISGNFSMDHARSIHLAGICLDVARRLLAGGGRMVVKVFQGDLLDDYYEEVGDAFDFVDRTSPEASRDASSELYVVGKGFYG